MIILKLVRPYPEYPDNASYFVRDVKKIKHMLLLQGYDVSMADIAWAWEQFSESLCASWMIIPEEIGEDTLDNVKRYLVFEE